MTAESLVSTPPTERLQARIADRAHDSLAREEEESRFLAIRGRTIALIVIAILVGFLTPYPAVIFYESLIALFVILGFAQLWLERSGGYRWWHTYLFITLDFALLAFTLLAPNPLLPDELPPQMAPRFQSFVYFYVMLAGLTFTLQPREVLWGGLVGALAWSTGVVWLALLPDSVVAPPIPAGQSSALITMAMPTYVDIGILIQNIIVFLIVAGLLALIVDRSRRLVLRQASLERERSNLARYFPVATVDRLAQQDDALAQIREQPAAVLFTDIVGFTRWSERHTPTETIALLRDVHARLEEAVFRHDGTLDKFIGDGLMATFGTPQPGPNDAANAVACVTDIVTEFQAWNADRRRRGKEPVRISLGLHYGPVVVGNIGTDRRLELAVLGDTVNVASRLESLTRELDCGAVISTAVADAVRAEDNAAAARQLAGFRPLGPQALRGRTEKVSVLAYG